MKTARCLALPALSFLVFGAAFTGCADSSFTETSATLVETDGPYSKMRNDHLFGNVKFLSRAKVLERYSELIVFNDFIVSYSDFVLDANRVLERYSMEEGVTIKRSYKSSFDGFAMHVDGTHVDRILRLIEDDNNIAWVEPDTPFGIPLSGVSDVKTNNLQLLPWGVDFSEGDLSFARSGNGSGSVEGVDVFVLDSGVNSNDINLASTVDFTANTGGTAKDLVGHGTHVAGTIGAKDDAMQVVGIAPGVRIHNYKVLNDRGRTDLSTVIAAVEKITELKQAYPRQPMVVNISFGADTGSADFNALDEAIQQSIASGVVYVIAAGNDAIDVSTVTPARVPEAITVAAVGPDGRHAFFSNFGPGIDLYAPGIGIESTASKDLSTLMYYPTIMSGTSMAAPHVTGAVALGLSLYPSATPTQINDLVKSASKYDVSRTPGGSGTTKARLSLDLAPFGSSDTTNNGGEKGGRKNK